jgi:hypothetical protein
MLQLFLRLLLLLLLLLLRLFFQVLARGGYACPCADNTTEAV